MTRLMFGWGLLLALLSLASATWSSDGGWSFSRRSVCGKQGDKCYSTGQCCNGYVCAAFDDYFGDSQKRGVESLNPEIPGFCVREKDLEPCVTSGDCVDTSKCQLLGHTRTRYCVPKPEEELEAEEEVVGRFKYPKAKGRLGATCKTDANCAAYTEDGKDKLCCQEVKRGRMGIKRQCDRIRTYSLCISKRK